MNYELVIFDWDGTLMDSTRVIASSLQSACVDVGVPVPSERDARYVIGLNLVDSFDHVAPDLDEAGRKRLSERYRHHFLARENEMPLYAGVVEMLSDLHAKGVRLAVATGKARRGLDRVLDATGLRRRFEATRLPHQGLGKPHHPLLVACIGIYGVRAQR